MDVTRATFSSLLPVIRQSIADCNFIAIDSEFTGLTAGAEEEYSLFDTPASRYSKLRESVQKFTVCQIGITTFTNDHWKNKFTATPFNCYVFPHEFDQFDERFSVQSSSFAFLCNHEFDFNKFIYDGIPYLTSEQEAIFRQGLEAEDEDTRKALEAHLTEAIGFSHVFKMLVEAGKPIVGHNMLMDLMFFFDKFHKPLPESYTAFKEKLHQLFPIIIDNKHVTACTKQTLYPPAEHLLRTSTLDALNTALSSKRCLDIALMIPSIQLHESCQRYEEARHHEAGYDSFITGKVLILVCHLKARQSMLPVDTEPTSWVKICRMIDGYFNQINMIRCSVQYLYLPGPDPNSCRPTWLTMERRSGTGKLSQSEVVELLRNYGSLDVEILKPSTCVVALATRNMAENVLEDFRNHPDFAVSEYSSSWLPSATTLASLGFGGVAVTLAVYYCPESIRPMLPW